MVDKLGHGGAERGALSRRTLLGGAAVTAASGVVGLRAAVDRPAVAGGNGEQPPSDGLRPVSMAMHVHGSFSEGVASYEAHLQQAREHGVDVIWWTDHDFRVVAHDYVQEVRFDGIAERRNNGLEWRWELEQDGELADASVQFVSDPRSADEPGRAMRISARGTGSGGVAWCRGVAWNWTYSVSLADTTIELDVLAEDTGPGRELLLEINASHHPARNGRPAGQYVLEYRLGGATEARRQADGVGGGVDVPVSPDGWERVRLRPVADIGELWPDLVAEDNSLHQLRIGVRAAAEVETRVVVDRLRIDRGSGQGLSGVELRRAVLDRYADDYGDIVQFESFEMSLVRHLNWIGGELAVPDLPSPPRRDNTPELAEQMVELMHSHGALVQWCHPLDVADPDALLRLMLRRHNLGADLVEIGRQPYAELRRVLDVAARNALFFTAVGASDDHDGEDWLDRADNNITYVWAASTGQADLLAALAAGRAWWLDPARWRGALDLRLGGHSALGGVLLTDADSVDVEIEATDLPPEGALVIVEGPVDLPGPADLTPATTVTELPAGEPYRYRAEPGGGSFVRLQVLDAGGDIVGESNPLWLLREPPPHGIPDARRISGA